MPSFILSEATRETVLESPCMHMLFQWIRDAPPDLQVDIGEAMGIISQVGMCPDDPLTQHCASSECVFSIDELRPWLVALGFVEANVQLLRRYAFQIRETAEDQTRPPKEVSESTDDDEVRVTSLSLSPCI